MGRTIKHLLDRARREADGARGEGSVALEHALRAGDALNEARSLARHGEWTERLRASGIPLSTARLYMQLARERERVEAAGCSSIREARRLVAGTKPRKPPSRAKNGRRRRPAADRYEEGYADGYRAGRADGAAQARSSRSNGSLPLDRKDLRWLIKQAHPDRHDGDLRATRVTQWLNELLGKAN
jgi:hypothetical protein